MYNHPTLKMKMKFAEDIAQIRESRLKQKLDMRDVDDVLDDIPEESKQVTTTHP